MPRPSTQGTATTTTTSSTADDAAAAVDDDDDDTYNIIAVLNSSFTQFLSNIAVTLLFWRKIR
jgi:hypothetical protein